MSRVQEFRWVRNGEPVPDGYEPASERASHHSHYAYGAVRDMNTTTKRGSLLREAATITEGARNKQHGHIDRNFTFIAQHWQTYLRQRGQPVNITGYDVAMMMTLMKIARTLSGDASLRDHYMDAAAYVAIAYELEELERPIAAAAEGPTVGASVAPLPGERVGDPLTDPSVATEDGYAAD